MELVLEKNGMEYLTESDFKAEFSTDVLRLTIGEDLHNKNKEPLFGF